MAQQTPTPPAAPAETVEDTKALRQELLDASKPATDAGKTPGGSPRGPRMISADAVGVGKTLAGRYKIIERLGVGGMGEVFKAIDAELNDLPVAIKVLPPMLAANTRSINRLRTEAAISLKLTHPHICRLHTFRVDGDVKFLVMEHIPGHTLEEMLDATDERKLPLAKMIPIARNVAEALDFAHTQNPPILHRDIKPSNVMVTPRGTGKVLDFGIARELKDSMTRMTGKDTSGTLLYMSPEQFTGSTPTAASDIYSFAAMLFECLCGHAPFWQGSIAHQLLNQTPVRIPDMPDHVNDALQAGLAKNGSDRPESAKALVRMLQGRGGELLESSGDGAAVGRPARPSETGQAKAPKPQAKPTPHASDDRKPKVHVGCGLVVTLTLLLACAAGVAYWQGLIPAEMLAKLGIEPLRTPPPTDGQPLTKPKGGTGGTTPPVAEATLDEATAAKQLAKTHWDKVKDVSPANGFDLKIEAARTLLEETGAEEMKSKQYGHAVATFKEVVTRCQAIKTRDGERQQATAARTEADTARKAAEAAAAAELAAALWQAAETGVKTGQAGFDGGTFASATAAWQEARQDFDKATVQAVRTRMVNVARKEWDDLLKTTDAATLTEYGGTLWENARSRFALAQAAGITEEAPPKWRAAAKLLAQAWTKASGDKKLAAKVAEHVTAAKGMIAGAKYADARIEADRALALVSDHTEATFLGAKADAGGTLAQAKAALDARPVESLRSLRTVLPDLKRLAGEAPADTQLAIWLTEAEAMQGRLDNMYRFVTRLAGHDKAITSLDITADGAEFMTGSRDGTVKLWASATGKALKTLDAGGEVTSAVYSPDGSQLAWARGAKLITAARAGAGATKLTAHEGHLLAILAVAFSPSGTTLVTCGEDDKVLLREASSGKISATLDNKDDVTCLAFSLDGKRAATGSGKLLVDAGDTLVTIWDISGDKPTIALSLGGHAKTVRAVAFSPDGALVASAGDDGAILLRDTAVGKQTVKLAGHVGGVSSLCFRADGKRLASAGADKTLRLWDPAGGDSTQVLGKHAAPVRAVRFLPDGKRLISVSEDGAIVIWALGLEAPAKPASN